ncbi:hypothetical protein [Adhaeribacter soli]|uniref:Uncharacterized protein n=1 Tax=Adhaeribacter soli TaxID=2607655 RepID=A0A5N1J082_9BACT|nr:hypothetical protein [Adhaeribacter soli]KAA9340030.1 hypothetical protein F0P94_06685 [Adhaeribacter soli]
MKPEKVSSGSVLDYELLGDKMFVLGWQAGTKMPVLKVLQESSDSVLIAFKLPFHAQSLYRDCVDNLHVLTETDAYQLQPDSLSLGLFPLQSINAFSTLIKPCAAANGNDFYLERPLVSGGSKAFFYVNKVTNRSKLLSQIQDPVITAMQQDEARYRKRRAVAELDRTAQSAARKQEFARKVLYQPPYAPLFKIGKEVAIFNHLQGNISFYQRDTLTRTIPITYPQRKDWGQEVIIDPVLQRAYGRFDKNGIALLEEIDFTTGSTGPAYKIAFSFARKIRVYNGRVYFIYRDVSRQGRDFLYAARLEEL